MILGPDARTMNRYEFIMYRLRSKIACLFKLVCFSKPKDASLLQNLSISHKLRIRNILY
jgi:hypothetical protein